jgi:WD40 repeat protein
VARIVCQVLHRPNRLTLIWSDGAASFEPYHLEDQELESFYQTARSARRNLARVVEGADPEAVVQLVQAGHQLYQAIFRHSASDPRAQQIQTWLEGLRDRNDVASFDVLGDVPGRIPWNAVYDRAPDEKALRSGDPAALRSIWGFQYVLAAGKRVNPLRVRCILDSPTILLLADAGLTDTLPAAQKNLLGDWAAAHELTVLNSITDLRKKLLDEAPDILYVFATVDRGSLRLGDERITALQVRDLLAEAKEGNPDPIVFLQVSGDVANWETWECFLGSAVNTLTGVVTFEVPVAPALANALGVEALSRFVKSERLGLAVKGARGSHDLATLAYSAFCPSHVKIAADQDTDPDVPAPEPLPLPESPYRPLAPYESVDRALFTGREDDTVRCAGLVDEAATRGLVLHGVGGVGKSSFLRAGLVPHLETEAVGYLALRDRTPEEAVRGETDYPVAALRPGCDLIGQLAEALCAFCAQPYAYTTPTGNRVTVDLPETLKAAVEGVSAVAIAAGPPPVAGGGAHAAVSATPLPGDAPLPSPAAVAPADLWRIVDANPNLLAGLLDELTRRLPFDLVLVIEQGEDLVLEATADEMLRRRRALEILGGVLRSPARCKVILSVRTEYLGRLMDQFPTGPERWRTYFLGELDEGRMLQAVILPTSPEPVPYAGEIPRQKYRFTFEHGVASDLVADVRRAARDRQLSALPLLQAACAGLYERMLKRQGEAISRADRKDLGPVDEAVVRYVNRKIKDLPVAGGDRPALQRMMEQLYLRHPDGTVTRELVPLQKIARSWKGSTPLETVIDAASQEGLLEANEQLCMGRPQLFLSLPQYALARTAAHWDEDRKRRALGRNRVYDVLWIMIPLMFLVGALTWTLTRRYGTAAASDEKLFTKEEVLKILQSQIELASWPVYLGQMIRADQAWNSDNPLLARKALLTQQPLAGQTDLRDFEWYYLWGKIRGRGPEAAGHKGDITSVAVAADGALGASASKDGTVKLWDLVTGQENATLKAHTGPVLAVAFSADGKTIASAGADKTVRLWHAAAGKDKPAVVEKEQKTLTGHTDVVQALAFGKDGLVSAGADKQVITWDLAAGKEAKVFKGHTTAVRALALAPDGKTIASAGTDQAVLIHDGAKTLQTVKTHSPVSALAFAPDGKTLASGGTESQGALERGMIRFWDPATGKETSAPLQHAGQVLALAYLPQAKLLASAGKDNLVRIWDPASGRQVSAHKGHIGWVGTIAVSGTGDILFSGSQDGTVKIWSSVPPDVIAAHEGAAQAVVFAPDDKAVVSGGRDGAVKFWDPATGKLLTEFKGLGNVTSLAFSSREGPARLAAGIATDKNEGEVRLWEVSWDKSGLKTKELPALKGHTKGVTCVAFTPDGKTLASGSADQTAIVWDGKTGTKDHVLKAEAEVRCLAFPTEQQVLATGAADGKVRQWEIRSGKEARAALQTPSAVNALSYFFGIVGFVTAGEDHSVRFWVWNPEEQPKVQKSHQSNNQAVTSLAPSPNRRFIAAGSIDRTVKLFNSEMEGRSPTRFFGEERFTLTGLDAPVRAVAVSGDSMVLAAADENGTIRFWRAPRVHDPRPSE